MAQQRFGECDGVDGRHSRESVDRIIAFTIFKMLIVTKPVIWSARRLQRTGRCFWIYTLIMNVSLAIFNLLPFPPLDGSKILYTILPASCNRCWDVWNSTALSS